MIPLSVLIAAPILYLAWRRTQRQRSFMLDASQSVPTIVQRAYRNSRIAEFVVVFVGSLALGMAVLGMAPFYWVPVAVVAVIALFKRLAWQEIVRREMNSSRNP